MKKKGIITAIIIIILLILGIGYALNRDSLNSDSYDEEWMIGKTRNEIEERYGEFDSYSVDGYYYKGKYIITEDKPGSIKTGVGWGTHLEIVFDNNGKAISAEVVSNGIGG